MRSRSVAVCCVIALAARLQPSRGQPLRGLVDSIRSALGADQTSAAPAGLVVSPTANPTPSPFPAIASAEAVGLRQAARAVLSKLLPLDLAGMALRCAFHDAGAHSGAGFGGANGSLQFELDRSESTDIKPVVDLLQQARTELSQQNVTLSLADLIQLAGALAVELTQGPPLFDDIPLGRIDATGPDPPSLLPSPSETHDVLCTQWQAANYTLTDLVALSGAHTIGRSRSVQPVGPLDSTPDRFDNAYYQALVNGTGSFASDLALMGAGTQSTVQHFAANQTAFFADFTRSYIFMGLQGTGLIVS